MSDNERRQINTKEIIVIRRNKKSRPFDVDGTCDTCKYADDSHEVCQVILCVHAISCLYDLYEAEVENG